MNFLVIFLAVAAPFLTKVPLATDSELLTFYTSPMLVWEVVALCLVGGFIAQTDKWAAALCWWVSLTILWHSTEYEVSSVQQIVFGILMMNAAQMTTSKQKDMATKLLCLVGVIEVPLLLIQATGWSLGWNGFFPDDQRPTGTLGNRSYVAAFLTMLIAVAPPIGVPILAFGVVLTKSVLGIFTTIGILLIRFPKLKWWILGFGAAFLSWGWWMHGAPLYSLVSRIDIWKLSFIEASLKEWLFGFGPGSWLMEVPKLQVTYKVLLREGLYAQAHNEIIQLVREFGLVSLVIFCGWLWNWRKRLMNATGFSVLMNSLVMFPFHTVPTAVLGATLIGFATSKEEKDV